MVVTYFKMEQLLATLETLADKETLIAIEESKKQVTKGEYVECSINDLEKVFVFKGMLEDPLPLSVCQM